VAETPNSKQLVDDAFHAGFAQGRDAVVEALGSLFANRTPITLVLKSYDPEAIASFAVDAITQGFNSGRRAALELLVPLLRDRTKAQAPPPAWLQDLLQEIADSIRALAQRETVVNVAVPERVPMDLKIRRDPWGRIEGVTETEQERPA